MAEGGKQGPKSKHSNPVYIKISRKNGEINKLGFQEMLSLARKLNVSGRGSSEVLRKRLKSHYHKLFLKEANIENTRVYYPYYIVIDFEATCEEKRSKGGYLPEIIEFPAVLVDSEALDIKDVFHEYVKPSKHFKLTEYCKELTGISQEQIDSASLFPEVLDRFSKWMDKHEISGKCAIVTDGPWDLGRFLYTQIKVSGLPYPKFAKRWVNIKKVFSNFYDQKKPTLDYMLSKLNFQFEGRPHSGIDDAKNISRVLIQLLKDGASVHVNERIDLSYMDKASIPGVPDIVRPVMRDEFCKGDEFVNLKENGPGKEDRIALNTCEEKDYSNDQNVQLKTLDEGTVEKLSGLCLT